MLGLELNKMMAAVLLALILGKIADLLGRSLISPSFLEKNAYQVEGISSVASKPWESEKGPEPIEPLLAKADIENGKLVAKKCLQCHTFEKGGPNRVGPNLWGIVGAKHGHIEAFSYSAALKGKEGVWDYEALNLFLQKPRAYVAGTKMAFAGLEKLQDRADLIAYLRTLSDQPAPLPPSKP
ncbi:MAG: c-type cytochrome [Alphaproteobacteria bacterium]